MVWGGQVGELVPGQVVLALAGREGGQDALAEGGRVTGFVHAHPQVGGRGGGPVHDVDEPDLAVGIQRQVRRAAEFVPQSPQHRSGPCQKPLCGGVSAQRADVVTEDVAVFEFAQITLVNEGAQQVVGRGKGEPHLTGEEFRRHGSIVRAHRVQQVEGALD